LEKFRGLNVKFHEVGFFWNLWNYFPKENSVKKVHGTADRVHDDRFKGFMNFIKYQPSASRSMVEIKWTKGVCLGANHGRWGGDERLRTYRGVAVAPPPVLTGATEAGILTYGSMGVERRWLDLATMNSFGAHRFPL
jgi:hypothetical protein